MNLQPALRDLDQAISNFANRFAERPSITESEEFVALVQATRRLGLLVNDPAPAPAAVAIPEKGRYVRSALEAEARERLDQGAPLNVNNGRSCPRCYSDKLVDKGGGCLICTGCKFDLGCGG